MSPGSVAPAPSSSTSYHLDQSQFSLLVSPTRLIVGQADVNTTQELTVVNRGQAPISVTIDKRNFSAEADGSLNYRPDAPYAAANWVTLSDTHLLLAPGETKVVRAVVKAPSKFEPGDHQVAVVFMVPAGRTAANIKINRGIATPVYIAAPGPVVDSVFLSGLHAPRFSSGGPVDVTATIHNNGTVHHDFRAPSPLTVKAAGKAQPFPDFTVPRDSIRDVSTTWKPPFLCICHPTVTLSSIKGGVQSETVQVIVFPWPWFAVGLGALLLILLAAYLTRRGYRAQVQRAAAAYNSGSGGDA